MKKIDFSKKSRFQTIIELLDKNNAGLTEQDKEHIKSAFGVRGQYAGYLTKNKPNNNKKPMAAAAWLAMQPNGYKISIGAIMFLSDEQKALYDKLDKFKYPAWLDRDKEILSNLGVW